MSATLDTLMDPPLQREKAYSPRMRRLASVLFVLLAAWLLSPALSATHVEAFSARIQTMAIMDMHHRLAQDDLAYPVDIEYFFTTRGGTIHVLEWIMKLTHTTGEINFRILIWFSFLLFAASSVVFVRRWSDEPPWAALAVLVLTPGLSDISFFFADNLPSAALVTLAIALISKRTALWTWFTAGALLACATLLRTDAIIAAPSLGLLALLQDKPVQQKPAWRHLLANWLLTFAGALVVFYLSWRSTGVSLRQSLLVGKMHNAIHNSWGDRQSLIRVIVLFFGPTILLTAVAVVRTWRQRSFTWKLVMMGWPLVFYIVFMTKAVELRDYLLLGAPFVLLLGATGLTIMLRFLTSGTHRPRLFARACLAFYLVVLIAPPMLIMHDGPRVFLGRIYSPPMWRRWQRSTDAAVQQLQSLAASTRPGERTLILTTFFQSDRYLHLALLQDGYAMLPLRDKPSCGGVDTYQKDGRTIFHIRTENPYWLLSAKPMSMPGEYVRGYQIDAGFQCLAPADYDRAYMVTWGRMEQGYMETSPEFLRPAGPLEVPFPERGTWHIGKLKFLQVQRILPLSPNDIMNIARRARIVVAAYQTDNPGTWQQPHSYAEFHNQAMPLVLDFTPGAKPR